MFRKIIRTYREAYAGLPLSVWLLSFVIMINRMGTMVVPFIALYLSKDLHVAPKVIGQILAVFGVGTILGCYFGGWICQRISAFKIQAMTLLCTGICFFILSRVGQLSFIAFFMFLVGFFSEAFRPANSTAIVQVSAPRNRTKAFALNRMGLNIGMAIGPAIGGFLAVVDYSLLFYIDSGTCLIAALLIAVLFSQEMGRDPDRQRKEDRAVLRTIMKDRPFVAMLILQFLICVVFFQPLAAFPVYLMSHYGLPEPKIGLLWTINTVIIMVFEMILVHRILHLNSMKIIALGTLFVGIGFGLLPLGSTYMFAIFTVVIWTIGEMFWVPLGHGLIANYAPEKGRSMYLGLDNVAYACAVMLAPFLGMWLYEINPKWVWYGCLGIGAITSIGWYSLSLWIPDPKTDES